MFSSNVRNGTFGDLRKRLKACLMIEHWYIYTISIFPCYSTTVLKDTGVIQGQRGFESFIVPHYTWFNMSIFYDPLGEKCLVKQKGLIWSFQEIDYSNMVIIFLKDFYYF